MAIVFNLYCFGANEVRIIKIASGVRISKKEMVIRLPIENPNASSIWKVKVRSHGQTVNWSSHWWMAQGNQSSRVSRDYTVCINFKCQLWRTGNNDRHTR